MVKLLKFMPITKWLRTKLRLRKRNFLRLLSTNKIQVVLLFLLFVVSVVVGFYFLNFNYVTIKTNGWLSVFDNLSGVPSNWGVFGDYVGGILNPSIALIALYLLVETYKLQKIELEATRKLLKISTDDQKHQLRLSALTAHLNSVLMRIDLLNSERLSLLQGVPLEPKNADGSSAVPKVTSKLEDGFTRQFEEMQRVMNKNLSSFYTIENGIPEGRRFLQIEKEIKKLQEKASDLEIKIESFYMLDLQMLDRKRCPTYPIGD